MSRPYNKIGVDYSDYKQVRAYRTEFMRRSRAAERMKRDPLRVYVSGEYLAIVKRVLKTANGGSAERSRA